MRLAYYNGARVSAAPGLDATCPGCGSLVVARCGAQRVHHWAHRGQRLCDSWWEPETAWHRDWKMHFPEDQQEVIRTAPDGERHIADVRTPQGLVLEFQHSPLQPDERAAREAFHRDLVWVVDGARLQRDWPRFVKNLHLLRPLPTGRSHSLFLHPFPEESFARSWQDSAAPVYFDFSGAAGPDDPHAALADSLWCLLPRRAGAPATILRITRAEFIFCAQHDPGLILGRTIQAGVDQWRAAQIRKAAAAQYNSAMLQAHRRNAPCKLRRRF